LSSVIARVGDVVNTGDVIAACAAEEQDLPYRRESPGYPTDLTNR